MSFASLPFLNKNFWLNESFDDLLRSPNFRENSLHRRRAVMDKINENNVSNDQCFMVGKVIISKKNSKKNSKTYLPLVWIIAKGGQRKNWHKLWLFIGLGSILWYKVARWVPLYIRFWSERSASAIKLGIISPLSSSVLYTLRRLGLWLTDATEWCL